MPFAPAYGGSHTKYQWPKDFKNQNPEFFKDRNKFLVGTHGVGVVRTSEGRMVAGATGNELAGCLQKVLQAYQRLPEAERRSPQPIMDKNLPNAAPPPGGLVLTIYDRSLTREEQGRYRIESVPGYGAGDKEVKGRKGVFRVIFQAAQRHALWLTEEECKLLIPERLEKGRTQKVPSALAKRVFLFGLIPVSAFHVTDIWQANSVRDGQLNLRIEEVSPQVVRMRIHGSALLVREGGRGEGAGQEAKLSDKLDVRLEGVLVFDRIQKRLTRWDMVGLGDYVGLHGRSRNNGGFVYVPEPIPFGFTFEIDQRDYDVPPERRRAEPFVLTLPGMYLDGHKDHYWDVEKWEAEWNKRNRK